MTLRRTILFLIVLVPVATLARAADKILTRTDWNGHRYCQIQRDDGSRIEIKGGLKDADATFLARVPAVEPAAEPVNALARFTDAEIITETKRRKLTATDLGFAVIVPKEVPK